jgi:hypothetical protein
MKQKLSVIGKIEPPFTDVDYREIDVLCEKLIETCQLMQNRTASVYAKNTASDIIDVLVDIKIDVQEHGKKDAQKMDDDGFVTLEKEQTHGRA